MEAREGRSLLRPPNYFRFWEIGRSGGWESFDRINKIYRIGDKENPDNPVNPVKNDSPYAIFFTQRGDRPRGC